MNITHHYGLQLPEFPFETVRFARGRALQRDCSDAMSAGETTLVRVVDINEATPAANLLQLLQIVDVEHQQLAEIGETNGSFVMPDDYQWGLTRVPDDEPALLQRWSHPLVPEDYALVAQVPLIAHDRRSPSYDQQTQIARDTLSYWQGKAPGDWMLDNVNVYQFVPRMPDNVAVYVDIDPRVVIVE